MFNDPSVTDIKVTFEYLTDWRPCCDERPDTTYTGLCCRLVPDIKVTIEKPGEEPRVLWVNDSWLDIMIVANPLREDCWCVLRIEEISQLVHLEETGIAASTEPSTWGGIKAVWAQN